MTCTCNLPIINSASDIDPTANHKSGHLKHFVCRLPEASEFRLSEVLLQLPFCFLLRAVAPQEVHGVTSAAVPLLVRCRVAFVLLLCSRQEQNESRLEVTQHSRKT